MTDARNPRDPQQSTLALDLTNSPSPRPLHTAASERSSTDHDGRIVGTGRGLSGHSPVKASPGKDTSRRGRRSASLSLMCPGYADLPLAPPTPDRHRPDPGI